MRITVRMQFLNLLRFEKICEHRRVEGTWGLFFAGPVAAAAKCPPAPFAGSAGSLTAVEGRLRFGIAGTA